jgi:predicted phosphodiesterase
MLVIGDVHGHHADYLDLIDNAQYSVQVGDFGFSWDILTKANVDPTKHRIIGGNHDNYTLAHTFPHYLGDFGLVNHGGVTFFFVRGERSVDAYLRTENISWWRDEELDMATAYNAVAAYEASQPDIVISHGCPADVLPFFVTNPSKYHPSRTAQLLDSMLEIHRPKLWLFGHHHTSEVLTDRGTVFQCLNELETVTI